MDIAHHFIECLALRQDIDADAPGTPEFSIRIDLEFDEHGSHPDIALLVYDGTGMNNAFVPWFFGVGFLCEGQMAITGGLAKAIVLSKISKPAERLDALGGIAALLRFKVHG